MVRWINNLTLSYRQVRCDPRTFCMGFLKVGVVLIWIVMIMFLVINPSDKSEPLLPISVQPQAVALNQWFGVYLQQQKIGYLHRAMQPTEAGYFLEEEGQLRLKLGETLQIVHLNTKAWTTNRSELERFEFRLKSEAVRMQVEGVVHPGVMLVKINNNGQFQEERILLSQPVHLPTSLEVFLIRQNPQPGQRFIFSLFDPTTLSQGKMEVEIEGIEMMKVGAETKPVLRMKGHFRGLTVHSWITEDGRVLREESPGGMILLAQHEAQARVLQASDTIPDLLSLAAAPASQPIPNPRAIRSLMVKVQGMEGAEAQRVFSIIVPQPNELATYRLPYAGDKSLEPYMRSERFIQSDHPKIQAAAHEAIGSETDARLATERLTRWVYRRLKKEYTVSLPDALTVLELKAGDCNEHTVLFTALARAAGIPTRMAAGVVYLNDRFYYHAWPEVWLGQWVAVDPTFGQALADATHLRLVIGGLDQQVQLASSIGRLKVEVISFR